MTGNDSTTVVTTRGYFQRLKSAVGGIVIGLALVVGAFVLLWWNEGRAVNTAKGLTEGAAAVTSISTDVVDAANNGKLVHASGQAEATGILRDPLLGIDEPAISLIREVEMFQWSESRQTEKRVKLGGSEETVTTYSYSKDWAGRPINSNSFHDPSHRNPPEFPIPEERFLASNVQLGAFHLNPAQIRQITRSEPYPLDKAHAANLPEAMRERADASYPGWLYIGNPNDPRIGDLRLRVEVVRNQPVSLVAQQNGSTFEPWTSQRDTTVNKLVSGTVSADTMFDQMQRSNRLWTWLLRGAGLMMMIMGIGALFNPLKVLFDVLPFLGSLVGLATGLFSTVLGFLLTLLTIAAAWFFYRPLLSVILIAICIGIFFGARKLAPDKPAATNGAAQADS